MVSEMRGAPFWFLISVILIPGTRPLRSAVRP